MLAELVRALEVLYIRGGPQDATEFCKSLFIIFEREDDLKEATKGASDESSLSQ
jgi:hypothetical protein